MKLALLNTTIATTDGTFEVKTISKQEARELIRHYSFSGDGLDSAIGHTATAEIMSTLLGCTIHPNRQEFEQQVSQTALVFKLNSRIPEGKVLTAEEIEEIGYTFKTMTRVE